MNEPKIDKEKVIIIPPQMRVWGVVVENEKHGKRLMLFGKIAVICGMISALGLVALVSYFYCL